MRLDLLLTDYRGKPLELKPDKIEAFLQKLRECIDIDEDLAKLAGTKLGATVIYDTKKNA